SDAICLQLFVFVTDCFSFRTTKKIDDIFGPESLPGTVNRAQRLLCDNGAVEEFMLSRTVITMAAGSRKLFAEIVEQKSATASFRFTVFCDPIELFQHHVCLLGITLDRRK